AAPVSPRRWPSAPQPLKTGASRRKPEVRIMFGLSGCFLTPDAPTYNSPFHYSLFLSGLEGALLVLEFADHPVFVEGGVVLTHTGQGFSQVGVSENILWAQTQSLSEFLGGAAPVALIGERHAEGISRVAVRGPQAHRCAKLGEGGAQLSSLIKNATQPVVRSYVPGIQAHHFAVL